MIAFLFDINFITFSLHYLFNSKIFLICLLQLFFVKQSSNLFSIKVLYYICPWHIFLTFLITVIKFINEIDEFVAELKKKKRRERSGRRREAAELKNDLNSLAYVCSVGKTLDSQKHYSRKCFLSVHDVKEESNKVTGHVIIHGSEKNMRGNIATHNANGSHRSGKIKHDTTVRRLTITKLCRLNVQIRRFRKKTKLKEKCKQHSESFKKE